MPLFGCFQSRGVSFEWHDFRSQTELDWGKSFHPESLEICLNLAGTGIIEAGSKEMVLGVGSVGVYRRGKLPLRGKRLGGEKHQFITVEYAATFLRKHFRSDAVGLRPLVGELLTADSAASAVIEPERLRSEHQQLIQALRYPPVFAAAQPTWFESKALELAASFFFAPEADLFCDRQKRLARERCEKVIAVLQENLCEPPNLEDLGRKVGCSHFYLSRTFSKEMRMTIAQYLRMLRMEKAAEYLKSGKFNVTQAALEVGYNSMSHFSQAFHETFGCCPGLYGIAPSHGRK